MLGLIVAIFGPLIPWFVADFSLALSVAGRVFLFVGIGRILTSVYLGIAGGRFVDQKIVNLGTWVMGIPCLITFLVPSFSLALITAFFWGAGFSFVESGLNSLVARLNQGNSGSALNKMQMFFGIGALSGPLLTSSLSSVFHWRFVYLAIFLLFMVFRLWFKTLTLPAFEGTKQSKPVARNNLLANHVFILLATLILLYLGMETIVGGWLNTYWNVRFAGNEMIATIVLTGFWVALTFGRLVSSWLLQYISRQNLLQIMSGLLAVFFGLLHISSVPVISGVIITIIGLLAATVIPSVTSLALDNFPGQAVPVSGYLSAAAGIGMMLGPWGSGLIMDFTSVMAFPFLGLLIALGFSLIVFKVRRQMPTR